MSCTSSDLDKTIAKFQKDMDKVVGGVTFTKFYTFCDGQSDGDNNMSPDPDVERHNFIFTRGSLLNLSRASMAK